jgi:hypothetical protein
MENALTLCMCEEENIVEVLSPVNVGLCSLLHLWVCCVEQCSSSTNLWGFIGAVAGFGSQIINPQEKEARNSDYGNHFL